MFTRIFALLLFLAVISVAIYSFDTAGFPEIDTQLTFQRIDGKQQTLTDFNGKPLLVTFWSPNCVICMRDVKQLNQLYEDNQGGKRFELLALSMYYDRPDWVIDSSTKAGMKYPVYFDLEKNLSNAFGKVVATPTSFLLDQNGLVVYRHEGRLDFTEIEQKLKQLIKT